MVESTQATHEYTHATTKWPISDTSHAMSKSSSSSTIGEEIEGQCLGYLFNNIYAVCSTIAMLMLPVVV